MILKETPDPDEMWDIFPVSDLFLTTSNSTILNGHLAMGAGHARQVRNRWKGIDKKMATAVIVRVNELGNRRLYGDNPNSYKVGAYTVYQCYGLLVSKRWPLAKLGLFQTKDRFWTPSRLDLIKYSTTMLQNWCAKNKTKRVDLPFPNIGCGGLKVEDVEPIIDELPDTVYVWRFA